MPIERDEAALAAGAVERRFHARGRLRDAWRSDDGQWFDTMIYGMLRTDWTATGEH